MEIRFCCPLELAGCGVFPVYGSLSWVTSIFFCKLCLKFEMETVCMRQRRQVTKSEDLCDILFLWTVNEVCLVSRFLNPKSGSEAQSQ